jgi:hypothetical protein
MFMAIEFDPPINKALAQGEEVCVEEAFRAYMFDHYGPLIPDAVVARLFSFRSAITFRQSVKTGKIPLTLFRIGDAKHYSCLTDEVIKAVLAAYQKGKKQRRECDQSEEVDAGRTAMN